MEKIVGRIKRYAFIFSRIIYFRSLIKKNNFDVVFIINGGYPGADLCRSAALSKVFIRKAKCRIFFNFHNFAVKPKFYEMPIEALIDNLSWLNVEKWISVSEACSRSLQQRTSFLFRPDCYTVYNGITKPRIIPSSLPRKSLSGNNILLMLASYERGKAMSLFLRHFRK